MTFRTCLGVTILGLLAGCAATADAPLSNDSDLTMAELPVVLNDIAAGTFDQKIDHANPDSPKFAQRYWYSTQFAKGPDAPVIFNFAGESEASAYHVANRADVARTLGAAVVTLEHRFYGKSLPFENPTVLDMKHLSIEAALDDAVDFEAFAKDKLGLKGPWIAVGGSYSGMLAAFYREKHPDLVVGAWASSAPIDMELFTQGHDEVTARALGSDCLALHKKVMEEAATAFDDPAQRDDLWKRIGAKGKWNIPADATDEAKLQYKRRFLTTFSSVPRNAAQGDDLHRYCSALAQDADPLNGFAGYKNAPLVAEDSDPQPEAPPAPPPPPANDGQPHGIGTNAGTMWWYQQCSQVAFFEVANADRNLSVMSDLAVDGQAQVDSCKSFFGVTPDTEASRASFYDDIKAGKVSNLFFVNGTSDPWSALSLNNPAEAPQGVTVQLVQLGAHCQDMTNLSPRSLLGTFEAHKTFNELAKKWIATPNP